MSKKPIEQTRSSSRDELHRPQSQAAGSGPPAWFAAVALAIAICAVYLPALGVPPVFDDHYTIEKNPSIFSIWPLVGTQLHPGPLNPPQGLPTSGRPLVNLSFALNYHFGGLDPRGYHAFNFVLHFLSSLLLWAIVRRTLRLPYFAGKFEGAAGWLALAVALLWALHPLQTESVVYLTQRTELMVALFYLATLYCSLHYWSAIPGSARRVAWLALAIVSSLAGMASKEVMASVPVIVLLFERTFVSGSLVNALRRSRALYIGLTLTWLLLFALNVDAPRGVTAGFGMGVPAYAWWLTQAKVLLMYLKLVVWPWPLLIYYQWPYLDTFAQAWMYVVPVMLLVVITLALLRRNRPEGYLGIWMFAILSPTLIIPIPLETAAERRMYLPLAALVVLLVVGGYSIIQRASRGWSFAESSRGRGRVFRVMAFLFVTLLAFGLGLVSARRLDAYNDEAYLWQEVLQYQPENCGAHINLGFALLRAGKIPEAIVHFEIASKISPDFVDGLNGLGLALTRAGRAPEAVDVFRKALARDPDNSFALKNFAAALMQLHRYPEAIEPLQHALSIEQDNAALHYQLGNSLNHVDRLPESLAELEAALALQPDYPEALNWLGITLIRLNRHSEAVEKLQQAVRLKPDYGDAHNNLGLAFSHRDQLPQAIEQFQLALKSAPNDSNAHYNLANALQKTNQPQEAIAHYQAAIGTNPDFLPAYVNLVLSYEITKQSVEAIATARQAIEVARRTGKPDKAQEIEGWLHQYQAQPGGGEVAVPNSQPRPSTK